MKHWIFYTFLIFIVACNTPKTTEEVQTSSTLEQLSSIGEMRGDRNFMNTSPKGYVVVLAPTLLDKNTFDVSLHTAGMFTYLENEKMGKVETILVSEESPQDFDRFMMAFKEQRSELFPQLTFINDTTKQIREILEVNPLHLDHAGEAMALDEEGNILYHLEEYRCQGEKLQRLYQTFFPRTLTDFQKPSYEIKVGEKLPTELLKYVENQIGKQNILMTFYPSPLSHACSIQMDDFTHFSDKKNLKMFGVSIGTEEQVNAWKMNQYVGLELLADSTGIISNDFNSLLQEEDGVIYSDRTVFLIDKKGIIKYINKDYDVMADINNLEKAIIELTQ